MVRLPSIKTIEESLADCREDAIAIRKIMEKERYFPGRMLSKVNNFLGGCGKEYIQSKQDDFSESKGITYINMGDTYIPTLCYDHSSGRIFISCWGDIVERNPKRFGE
jgi:hypothetical protein